ncbi:MAG TPA: hypothetical protein VLE95_00610 [Chlamydiales bacterium]|nr:hypothetical protein [Chlamydiales bacterium]
MEGSIEKVAGELGVQGTLEIIQLEIIIVFSARLYGARSRKNQKVLEALKEAAATL